jgi:hypothetical protein
LVCQRPLDSAGVAADLSELDLLLFLSANGGMATIGTSLAVLIAGPLCLVAPRNVMPESFIYLPAPASFSPCSS